ncbi:hypothetical protein MNV49_000402 [Pseudohyphozyma bogoriensis]|nr:hypothetical protein MNV49_000402 [Pseudohyphozyma bogoriensis]
MPGRDVFSTLPPELGFKIFDTKTSLLSPNAIHINKALLPYARRTSYAHLVIKDDIQLAALGETLLKHPDLGALVHTISIVEPERRSRDAYDMAGWLQDSFVAAFNLPNVTTVTIHRQELSDLLNERILGTAAFQSATTLNLSSPSPIPFADLRWLHKSPTLRELNILTAMRYSVGRPSGIFEVNASRISRLQINAEPHAAEFEAFLSHLQLESLDLRCGTPDLSFILASLGETTRESLRDLTFTPAGYLQQHLSPHAFLGFNNLRHLSLWSSSLDLSPDFFEHLSPLPLVSVVFRGPPNGFPLLNYLAEFVSSGERPASLSTIGVDVNTAL